MLIPSCDEGCCFLSLRSRETRYYESFARRLSMTRIFQLTRVFYHPPFNAISGPFAGSVNSASNAFSDPAAYRCHCRLEGLHIMSTFLVACFCSPTRRIFSSLFSMNCHMGCKSLQSFLGSCKTIRTLAVSYNRSAWDLRLPEMRWLMAQNLPE